MMRRSISRFLSSSTRPAISSEARRLNSPLEVLRTFSSSFSSPAAEVAADDGLVLPIAATKVAADPTVLQPRVVIYDGVCHLCHRGVQWVIKKDKYEKIKFCRLQSKSADPYLRLCGVDREDVLRRFVFIEGLGAYYEGSTAALKVASYLPFPYSTLSSLFIIPAPLRDAVYDHIAKRRYDWFGKAEECIVVQDKELLERFIDRDEMLGEDNDSDQLF